MNSLLQRVVAVVALVLGIGCLSYPIVSNLIIGAAQERVAKENIVVAESLDEEARVELIQDAREYNEKLAAGMTFVSDPFNPDAPSVGDEEYYAAMSLPGQDAMAAIRIPSIEVFVPVYHGTSDEVLRKGAGHLGGSSLPVGGESSHCVVAGHTGLPSVQIFDKLDKVETGDLIFVDALGEALCYEVVGIEVVEPEDTDSLRIVEGEDLLTLVTCTPYGINTHRLLVHAQRCELPATTSSPSEGGRIVFSAVPFALVAGVAAVVVAAAFVRYRRREKLKAEYRTTYAKK